MNRQTRVCILSFCLAPCFLLLPGLGKLETQYCHFPRQLLVSLQQVRLDSLRTEKQYLAALHAAVETTFKNEFETEFLLLLDAQQTQAYDSLTTLDGRKAYIENYWKASNPNPLLPENDWLVDVLKRRAYARENFPAPEPPYFDDRGKYYFKYGKPSFRFEDAGDFNTYPNESWSYENVTRNFLAHFVKEGAAYRDIDDLTMILITGRRMTPEKRAANWSVLAIKRAAVSPVFGRAAVRLHELATAQLHAAAFSNSLTVLTIEAAIPHTIQMQISDQAQQDVIKARDATPPAAHDEINAVNKLQFTHDLAQFRGPKGATRLEIALLSPFNKNLLKKFSRDSGDTLRLGYRCLLRDRQFEPIAEDAMMSEFQAKLAATAKFPNAVGKLTVSALPGESELTLQIKDVRQDKIGFTRQTLGIRDFRGDALMISDIQFLTEATSANQRQILPVFTKLNTAVAPYPFEKIKKTIPLLCYFEIYNLKSSGITDNYEVVYKVISEKSGDKNIAVSVTYTRPVTDDTAPELIGIDLRQAPKGAHRLEITVTAMNDRRITAITQKEIIIE
ncbi:GWxTD domain-containing protein [candidate division KSB1 bacterium]|nr:GWxTD domain-containing protein [candidate division KSB1 bacterium]